MQEKTLSCKWKEAGFHCCVSFMAPECLNEIFKAFAPHEALQKRRSVPSTSVRKESKKYLDEQLFEQLFVINTSSAFSALWRRFTKHATLKVESSSEQIISSHLFYLVCFMPFLSSHVILTSYLFYLSLNLIIQMSPRTSFLESRLYTSSESFQANPCFSFFVCSYFSVSSFASQFFHLFHHKLYISLVSPHSNLWFNSPSPTSSHRLHAFSM